MGVNGINFAKNIFMKTIYIALGNRASNILYELRNNRMSETNQFLYLDSDSDSLSRHGKSIRETVTLVTISIFKKNCILNSGTLYFYVVSEEIPSRGI